MSQVALMILIKGDVCLDKQLGVEKRRTLKKPDFIAQKSGFFMPITIQRKTTMGNYKELEDIIENSRLRSKQNKRRSVIKDQDKQILKVYKTDKILTKQKRDLPMIDLNPPVQKGWKRYFILREDVRQSKYGVFYENILQKINTTHYSDSKSFKRTTKVKRKRKQVEKQQELKQFSPYEFQKLKFTDKEIACFELKIKLKRQGKKVYEEQYYEFIEKWRFMLRIRPNIIDKVKVFDVELEQRLAELDKFLWDSRLKVGRLDKLLGRRKYKNWEDKHPSPFKTIAKQDIVEAFS